MNFNKTHLQQTAALDHFNIIREMPITSMSVKSNNQILHSRQNEKVQKYYKKKMLHITLHKKLPHNTLKLQTEHMQTHFTF